MYFCVNEFEVGITDSIFSGNEQEVMNRRLKFVVLSDIK